MVARLIGADVEERTIEVAGLRTHYAVAGQGPPVVLLHGNEENLLDWSWVLPELARHHTVYALDLPGSGGSDKPAADYSPEFFAQFLERFLDAAGLDGAVLVGNSLGGLTALSLAIARPERVRALVLIDSAGLGPEINPVLLACIAPGGGDLLALWGMTPLGAAQRAWARSLLLFGCPSRVPFRWLAEQVRLAQLPRFLAAGLSASRGQSVPWGQRVVLREQLPRLTMPVLVLWGALDQVIPVSHARAALPLLRRGTGVIIPDCGHMPHVERPAETLAALRPFLAAHAA